MDYLKLEGALVALRVAEVEYERAKECVDQLLGHKREKRTWKMNGWARKKISKAQKAYWASMSRDERVAKVNRRNLVSSEKRG